MRWPRYVAVTVFAGALAGSLSGCGGGHSTASPKADQSFLNSVYSGAPDISSYRTIGHAVLSTSTTTLP